VEGDIVLVSPVSAQGQFGVAIVTLQLDELRNERAARLTGETARLSLTESGGRLLDEIAPEAWRRTVTIANRPVTLHWRGSTGQVTG
jgi:hypothetical protein